MAYKSGELISMNDIINGYMNNVYKPIIQNAYHYDNQPPKDQTYFMIQPERLGKLSQLQSSINKNLNNMGTSGGLINASLMVKMMVECTRLLTKVGTWSYVRAYRINDIHYYDSYYEGRNDGMEYVGYSSDTDQYVFKSAEKIITTVSKSGKALFSDSYIKSLSRNPSGSGTPASGNLIPITGLNSFFAELLSIWKSTSKYANSVTVTLCHSDCYSNCHNDCYDNDCYKS